MKPIRPSSLQEWSFCQRQNNKQQTEHTNTMAMAMGAACRCRQRQCWLQWQALAQLSLLLLQISSSTAFITIYPPTMNILSPAEHSHHHPSIHPNSRRSSPSLHPRSSVCNGSTRKIIQLSSSWDNFAYDDDDGLDDDGTLMLETPNFVPADENDDPSVKAAAGMSLQPPEVDYDGPVIDVPQGKGIVSDSSVVLCVISSVTNHGYISLLQTSSIRRIDTGIGRRDCTRCTCGL